MEAGGTIQCLCFDVDLHPVNNKDVKISVDFPEGCVHKRVLTKIIDPNLDLPPIYADQGCVQNEYHSLVNRHLVELLPTDPEFLEKCRNVLKPISELIQVEKMSNSELISSRPPRMRKRYRKALTLDLKDVHSWVNLFIKFEKKDDPTKAPRAIQYRATPYTARLAKYIIPIEKNLYKTFPSLNHGFRFVAKGLNAIDRAEILYEMFNWYHKPIVYLIDHSKFDSRVNKDLLQMEHEFYLNCFKGDRWLKFLLKQQVHNKGRSRNGLKYSCTARRMSGDANTALGNCLINYAILRAKFGDEAIIFLDGDDSVVFMPRYVDVDFSDTGMVSKVSTVNEFEDIDFCQSNPVWTGQRWVMCRNPIRALSRALYKVGTKPFNWMDYLATIGIGEGLCSPSMPITSILAKKFRSYGGEFKWYFSEYRLGTQKCSKTFEYPNVHSRVSFAQAFDIDPNMQKLIEREILAAVLKW